MNPGWWVLGATFLATLGAAALVLLTVRRGRRVDGTVNGPSPMQGCAIALGGVLLGFFGCVGVMGANVTFGRFSGLVAIVVMLAGYGLSVAGIVWFLLGLTRGQGRDGN